MYGNSSQPRSLPYVLPVTSVSLNLYARPLPDWKGIGLGSKRVPLKWRSHKSPSASGTSGSIQLVVCKYPEKVICNASHIVPPPASMHHTQTAAHNLMALPSSMTSHHRPFSSHSCIPNNFANGSENLASYSIRGTIPLTFSQSAYLLTSITTSSSSNIAATRLSSHPVIRPSKSVFMCTAPDLDNLFQAESRPRNETGDSTSLAWTDLAWLTGLSFRNSLGPSLATTSAWPL